MKARLGLLGPTEITRDGEPVRGFESRKALALLCYLAVCGKPVPRPVLADLFWQDKPEAQGRANLSRVLNNLSSLFPNTLRIDRENVQLVREAFELDIEEFEALCVQGDAESLAAAARLERGEFMAGIFLDNCPDFEIWLVAERERWRQRVVSVLECLAGHYARRGEPASALPFAARLLEMEPWHEEMHRQMMRLLARTGQRSAALQQYETARRVLAQELGVEPGAETTALYQQIVAGDIAPRAMPPHNLPLQLTAFFGRETELTRITARLQNPDCRLLTLVGAGGIGKTRLALEAAHSLLNSFGDGVYFVSLAPIDAGQIEVIVPEVAAALGFSFAGSLEPRQQLLNHLREKQMLLVLDNFEHMTDRAGLVIDILQHAPKVKVLVTSREPLDVKAEWLTHVDGLSFPARHPAPRIAEGMEEQLLHYSAVHLFVNRAQQVDERFALNLKTTPHVVRLCQIVEGMPLALELAAARTRMLGVDKICAHVERNLDFLATTMRDAPARHRSLRAVLDWSYASLSREEQELFQRLAVFAGGWTLDAAESVGNTAGETTEPVFEILGRLINKSLVLVESPKVMARYRMLETIQQYALAKFAASGMEHEVRVKQARYLLTVAEADTLPDSWFYPNQALLERLETEHDNLRAVLAWSQSEQGSAELGLQLAAAMLRYWFERGLWSEWRGWLEGALVGAETLPRSPATARVLFGLGTVLALQGEYQASQTYLARSQQLFAELGITAWSVYVSYRLGWLARERGDGITARRLMEESVAHFRELGDADRVAEVLITLVEVAVMQEDVVGAAAFLEEGLTVIRALGRKDVVVPWALNHAGHVAQLRGEYVTARQLHAESLQLFAEFGTQHPGIAWAHQGLGETALAEGNSPLATTHLTDSLLGFRGLGDRMGIAWCLAGFGAVAALDGKAERAARLWGAAEALRQSIGTRAAPATLATHERMRVKARGELGVEEFEAAWNLGPSMSLQQVLTYALEPTRQELRASPE